MNAWQSATLTVLVQVTAIVAGAAIAMRWARQRAALRHAIGVLALAFLLVSPALACLLPRAFWLSGGPLNITRSETELATGPAREQPTGPIATVVPEYDQSTEENAEPIASRPIGTIEHANKPYITTSASEAPTRSSALTGVDRTVWLNRGFMLAAWIWAVGIVVLCVRFFWVRRQLRALAASVQSGFVDEAAAAGACRALGLKSLPPIGISDLAPMPLVLGCWRPIVVLPRRLVETGSRAQLRDVLIHETAHIVRLDPWINFAQQVARVVFWPHPGVHWLNRQIAQSREEVCDNFVLHGGSSTDYAQTLLELAEHCGSRRFALSLLGMFSRRWSLEARIAGILDPGRIQSTCASRIPLAVVTLLLAAITMFVGGVKTAAQDAKESNTRGAEQTAGAANSNVNKPAGATKKITLRGVCHDENAQPVANVWARVFRCDFDGGAPQLVGEVHSDDSGQFSIPDVEVDNDAARTMETAYLQLAVSSKGYASAVKQVDAATATDELSLEMSKNPGTLSGVVTDAQGRPIKNVIVFLPCCGYEYIPNLMSAVTDQQGRYAIDDLRRWKSEDSKTFDAKTGIATGVTSCAFLLRHPDYAQTRASYSGIPKEVNVVLVPPSIIEGQVIDQVTGKPLPNVVVTSQGVARYDSHRTQTDASGHYRLRTNKDHFNIWADADDRIAIAAKAIAAEPGKTVKDVDIRMVRGGFVAGTVIDHATGKPVAPTADKKIFVAHYGPARPRTGAAVTSTPVNPDGSYRLRVAPGKNFVYVMVREGGTSVYVDVPDSGETRLDLRMGKPADDPAVYDDPDLLLAGKLQQEAREEDEEKTGQASGATATIKPPTPQRPDTPAGRLLDKLEQQNAGSARFRDTWLRTLKAIVDLGPDAVPELITELESTSDNMMLRSCGFMLRALNDKRAVPALIRSIPKTLLPPGSDMGLSSDDAELVKWAKQNDLDDNRNDGNRYGFGRPVREIFGALNKLTGQKMGEQQLYSIFLDGIESQRRMKRELFDREAKQWADWWEQHAAEYTQDPVYTHVNLPQAADEATKAPPAGAHYQTGDGTSGWVLQSIFDPKADQTFYDLDTGRVASLPEKWREAKNIEPLVEEILAWAAREGFDLMGAEYTAPDGQRYYALRAVGMQAWELDAKRWKMTSKDITVEALQAEGTPVDGLLLHVDKQTHSIDPKATAPFLFITRQGTPGLLFVGIEVKDDSLKPGGSTRDDGELDPVAFKKGRRFGFTEFEEVK